MFNKTVYNLLIPSIKEPILKSINTLAANKVNIKIQKNGWECKHGLFFENDYDNGYNKNKYYKITAQDMTLRQVIQRFVIDNRKLLEDNDLYVDHDDMPTNWCISQSQDEEIYMHEKPYDDKDLDLSIVEIFEELDSTFYIVRVDDSIIEGDLNNYGHGYEHSGW